MQTISATTGTFHLYINMLMIPKNDGGQDQLSTLNA